MGKAPASYTSTDNMLLGDYFFAEAKGKKRWYNSQPWTIYKYIDVTVQPANRQGTIALFYCTTVNDAAELIKKLDNQWKTKS